MASSSSASELEDVKQKIKELEADLKSLPPHHPERLPLQQRLTALQQKEVLLLQIAAEPTLEELERRLTGLTDQEIQPFTFLQSPTYTDLERLLARHCRQTMYRLAAQPLPVVHNHTIQGHSTYAAGSKFPHEAQDWGMSEEMMYATLRPLVRFHTHIAQRIDHLAAGAERDTRSAISMNMHHRANLCLGELAGVTRQWLLRIGPGADGELAVPGVFPARATQPHAVEEFKAASVLRNIAADAADVPLAGTPPEYDILAAMRHPAYQDPDDIRWGPLRKPIGQLFGYMCANQVNFGVLSSYNTTQLVYCPHPAALTPKLWVSDVVPFSATGPTGPSVVQRLVWIGCQASSAAPYQPPAGSVVVSDPTAVQAVQRLQDLREARHLKPDPPGIQYAAPTTRSRGGPPPPPAQLQSWQGLHTGSKNSSNSSGLRPKQVYSRSFANPPTSTRWRQPAAAQPAQPECELLFSSHALGTGASGVVWLGTYMGEPVAIKTAAGREAWVQHALRCEADAYRALPQLQGVVLPRLLASGLCNGELTLVLQQLDGVHPSKLPPQQRAALLPVAEQALNKLHNAGWLHNDMKDNNVICDVASSQVFLIDLGAAVRCWDPKFFMYETTELASIFG